MLRGAGAGGKEGSGNGVRDRRGAARRDPGTRKVDVRLPGKWNSKSHGKRPVHLIITMTKWILTRSLSIKNFLSLWKWRSGPSRGCAPRSRSFDLPLFCSHIPLNRPLYGRVSRAGRVELGVSLSLSPLYRASLSRLYLPLHPQPHMAFGTAEGLRAAIQVLRMICSVHPSQVHPSK